MLYAFAGAVLAVLLTANVVCADVAFVPFGSPDFENSPPLVNVMAGLGLAATFLFSAAWVLRNPRAGLGLISLLLGVVVGLAALLALLLGIWVFVLLLALMAMGFVAIALPRLPSREAYRGVSLALLLFAVGGVVVTIVALDQMTWTRRQRPRDRDWDKEKQKKKDREDTSEKKSDDFSAQTYRRTPCASL